MVKILIIDDSIIDHDLIRLSFGRQNYRDLIFVSTGEEGLELVKREVVSAIFVNQYLPDMDGFKFLRKLKNLGVALPVIMLIHRPDKKIISRAFKEGAVDTLLRSLRYFNYMPYVYERAVAKFELEKERRALETLIKKSQRQWMVIFDGITDFIFMTDSEHRIVRTNKAMALSFGKDPKEIIGVRCYELFDLNESRLICKFTDLPRTEEVTIRDRSYLISVFPLEYDSTQLFIHVMKDITEMKRLKEQLYHADKLASLGLLISGVAHELNNPLTGILAYAELLHRRVIDGEVKEELDKIIKAAERCKGVVENLLTFSRQKAPSRSLESINDVIDKAIELRIYWLRKGNIEIVKNYGYGIPTLYIDSQQIQQVILNLILNAEHAIQESRRERGRIEFVSFFNSKDGKVIVKVKDNGKGIPDEIINRIFDPFFTTKPVGVGTGLGLSISHGIISEHGGSIKVESSSGEGTCFTIELPVQSINEIEAVQIERLKKNYERREGVT